jgi:manganese-dependent inorganic pyrophosphatase
MDHNEPSQTVDGADQVDIIEVVDHHRVSGFNTALPISMIIQPVGSTCTIVAEQYKEHGQEISKKIGGLLLSGIISDTVSGKSPTTTERDLRVLSLLEGICGINRDTFAMEMFNASSILEQKNPKEIILNDFKEFNIGGKKVGVGQVEVVGFEFFVKIKDTILYELNKLKKDREFDLVALMVSDITHETTLLAVSADPVLNEMLGLKVKEKNIFEMKGVLSRKKQVIPHLINVLGN